MTQINTKNNNKVWFYKDGSKEGKIRRAAMRKYENTDAVRRVFDRRSQGQENIFAHKDY